MNEKTRAASVRDNGDDDLIDLKSIIGAFRRRIGVFVAVFLLVFSIVALTTFQMTPTYTSIASVMIDVRKTEVADMEAVLSGLPPDSAAVDTEVELIKSRDLAGKIVDKLKLTKDPEFNGALREPEGMDAFKKQISKWVSLLKPDQVSEVPSDEEVERFTRERVIGAVQSGLRVSRLGLTYVINISFESESPRKSAQIANAFADSYLFEQLEAKFDATSRANEWLNERLAVLREEVKVAESGVEAYRLQSGLLSAEGSSLTEQQISDLTAQLVIQRAEYEEAEARLNSVQSQMARGSSADTIGEVLSSQVISDLRRQQAEVARRRAELSSRYGALHPDIQKVEREAIDLQAQIDQQVRRIVSSLESEVDVARQRVRSLESSVAKIRTELASNNRSQVRLRELERDAEASRTLYESFLSRFKETGEQQDVASADARVLSRAAIPTGKSSPKTTLNLALGLVLGAIAGAGLVFLLEMLDGGLMTGAQIERDLGVAYIASVPIVQTGVLGTIKKLTGDRVLPQDYLVDKPLSSYTESYRTLRSSIVLSNVDREQKVVSITSALPGEGKTTSAYCLGRLSAMSGAKTIVVDCDLRRRLLSKALGDDKLEVGLLQYLAGQTNLHDVIVKDSRTSCELLPLAHTKYTPSDVFGSRAFKVLIETLKSEYDLVILDTAPILPVAETRAIANLSDTVVLVAKWRKTNKDAVASAIDILEDVGAHLSGVLLTQVNPKARSRYGYGDYGYYYSSYRKYYVD